MRQDAALVKVASCDQTKLAMHGSSQEPSASRSSMCAPNAPLEGEEYVGQDCDEVGFRFNVEDCPQTLQLHSDIEGWLHFGA